MKTFAYFSPIIMTALAVFCGKLEGYYEPELYHQRPGGYLGKVSTEEEQRYVNHAKKSVANAHKLISKIDDRSILEIEGMSNEKVRQA